jgi:hypothetical protein
LAAAVSYLINQSINHPRLSDARTVTASDLTTSEVNS